MLVPKTRSKDLQFRSKFYLEAFRRTPPVRRCPWRQATLSQAAAPSSVSRKSLRMLRSCRRRQSSWKPAASACCRRGVTLIHVLALNCNSPTRTASTTSSSSTAPSPAPLLRLKAPQYTYHHHRYPRCHHCRFLIPLLFHAPACKVPLDWEGVVVDVVVRRPLRSWWWMCIWWRASAAAAATGLPRAPGAAGLGAARGGGEP
jgi:hypothetical protein